MAGNLQQLLFTIGLIDRASGPAGRMMNNINRVTDNIQRGIRNVGYGAAGLVGVGYALNDILEPAKELNRALADVRSLDVSNAALNQLTDTALKFSMRYGDSAADFIKSSYDIQSAIVGLTTDELSAFTNVSGILAKGTKAQATDVTNFVGTMFGIFQKDADAMGRSKWIEQLAGQSAVAVKLFKTTGTGMAQAFESIGAAGQTNGIKMSEQIAILGTLQATMSGSEAGTKYRSFLDNVGKAQGELNMQFTDAQGRMLPIINILQKIRAKYGDIDTVTESDALKKAFGSEEAVALVKLLSTNIDGLNTSIGDIGKQTGMQVAVEMANQMADPWQRLDQSLNAIKIVLGQTIITTLLPALEGLNSKLSTLYRWTQLFPNLTKAVGTALLAIFGFMAAGAAFMLTLGVAQLAIGGFRIILNGLLEPIWNLAKWLWRAIPAIWSFTVALLSNPITWWIIGITAVVALVAVAIIYWDQWTQAVINVAGAFLEWTGIFSVVDSVLQFLDKIPNWWNQFIVFLSSLHPFDALLALADEFLIGALAKFNQLKTYLGNFLAGLNPFAGLGAGIDSIIGKVNRATGFSIPTLQSSSLNTSPKASTPPGGIGGQISSIMYANKSNNVGNVTVQNYGQPISGARLRQELLMSAP